MPFNRNVFSGADLPPIPFPFSSTTFPSLQSLLAIVSFLSVVSADYITAVQYSSATCTSDSATGITSVSYPNPCNINGATTSGKVTCVR